MADKIKIDTIRGGNLLGELRTDDAGIIEDSSRMNGELPKGWIVTTIGDILDFNYGKSLPDQKIELWGISPFMDRMVL